MEINSRRLTGANLHWERPSAIIDLTGFEGDTTALSETWQSHARDLLAATGYAAEALARRHFRGGVSLLISAPIDVLYTMCELNELALALALNELGAGPAPDTAAELRRLQQSFSEAHDPLLLALQAEAARRDVPFLWDDDAVSVGYGRSALCWPADALPDPGRVDWGARHAIPVALVTGTNGKSTTVRMAAAMIAAAGLRAGLTSTDWIRVGDTILDTGDYSGTGGARTLLRHPDTEVAVLETARGGLLRRGLGVERAAAALITNVAADHLGDYGIHSVPELIEAKFIVRRALSRSAPLLLNADDAGIAAFAARLDTPIRWFSLDRDHPLIRRSTCEGRRCAFLDGDRLVLQGDARPGLDLGVSEVPATLAGAARYNIANALGALLLCDALGVEPGAMRAGLAGFRGDTRDNPGRGNWFEGRGIRVLVDFAHNAHGMQALADTVCAVPAERRVLLIGQAGDRADTDIREMALAACRMRPVTVLNCALPGYERGRPQAEVQAVIRQAAEDSGVDPGRVHEFDSPVEGARFALDAALPGDLLVLFALTQRQAVFDLIRSRLDN